MKWTIFLVVFVLLAASVAPAQDASLWRRVHSIDQFDLKQAGRTLALWDSVTTAAVWSEPFRSWDNMSAIVQVLKDSVRGYWEYWSGQDTARASMVYGRTLEWDKAANLDSAYTSSKGYWNCNITASAVPKHMYGRFKFTPGASGGRKVKDDSLLTVKISGRK